MGQTKKRNYDRYTLAFKLQAVRLSMSLHRPTISTESGPQNGRDSQQGG